MRTAAPFIAAAFMALVFLAITPPGARLIEWATRDRVTPLLDAHNEAEARARFAAAALSYPRPDHDCVGDPCSFEDNWRCSAWRDACTDCYPGYPCLLHDEALWAELERRAAL